MAIDLPPYLTNVRGRNVPWKGHDTFPRNVVRIFREGSNIWHRDLRVFKKVGVVNVEYRLLSDEEVDRYMKDPDYV